MSDSPANEHDFSFSGIPKLPNRLHVHTLITLTCRDRTEASSPIERHFALPIELTLTWQDHLKSLRNKGGTMEARQTYKFGFTSFTKAVCFWQQPHSVYTR